MANVTICKRCVLDTTVKDIYFNSEGICKYCLIHDELDAKHNLENGNREIEKIINRIKNKGSNREFDCVCGTSGGRDSSYTLLKAVEYGLRPLVISVDNGWGTKIAEANIVNACRALDLEFKTIRFDWDEYKDLQRSFFFAGVPDVDLPTDLAIYAALHKEAHEQGIKYILNGHSFRTEGSSPLSWSYFDPLYIRDVQNKFGTIRYNDIQSIPVINPWDLIKGTFVHQVREIRILEYIDYRKKEVDVELKQKLNWEDYGGHHQENKFTHFIQSYYLPEKFGIDKRKTELSAQIRSGHITRQEALETLEIPITYDKGMVDEVISRLGFEKEEFEGMMQSENRSYKEFRTLIPLYKVLSLPINIITRMGLLPRILYLKYCR